MDTNPFWIIILWTFSFLSVSRFRADAAAAEVFDVRPAHRRPVLLGLDDVLAVRGLEPAPHGRERGEVLVAEESPHFQDQRANGQGGDVD